MRKPIYAVLLAFALGGLAPLAAQAGEGGCSYGGHTVKKNDLETPPPAASTTKKNQG